MSTIIELGSGKFVIDSGFLDGKPALFIEPAPEPGVIGQRAPDGVIPKSKLVEGGVAIILGNLESARVLIEELTAVVKAMNPSPVAESKL